MDKTKSERQARRRAKLDKIARAHGWKSWSEYETNVINKGLKIERKTS